MTWREPTPDARFFGLVAPTAPGYRRLEVATELSEMESARLALARGARASDPELMRSLHQLARVTASTLDVDRVGVWTIDESWQQLRCVITFDRNTDKCTSGTILELSRFPAYAHALKERRVIAAEDACADPRTRELEEAYLKPNSIRALLDSPVYEDGQVVAIVCHECVGRTREWSKRDRDFAATVADIAATLFAQVALIRFEGELRATREELAQARVMDSLGRMAAGVAHDFNNVLMGIALAIDVLDNNLPPDSPARDASADARALIAQGTRLVKTLLTFARRGAYSGQPVEVHAQIEGMLPGLKRLLGQDVGLTTNLDAKPALVSMDASMLEQVVLNLVLNARDAMPGGGDILIASERDGDWLILIVRDTGLGMDAATRQRIFEPFFTTKGQKGSGLGLAIVFGAVRAAGGTIDVDSKPGAGSTFTIRLPLEAASRS